MDEGSIRAVYIHGQVDERDERLRDIYSSNGSLVHQCTSMSPEKESAIDVDVKEANVGAERGMLIFVGLRYRPANSLDIFGLVLLIRRSPRDGSLRMYVGGSAIQSALAPLQISVNRHAHRLSETDGGFPGVYKSPTVQSRRGEGNRCWGVGHLDARELVVPRGSPPTKRNGRRVSRCSQESDKFEVYHAYQL
jgi:hypothetical protein